jgi:hypothetical protein
VCGKQPPRQRVVSRFAPTCLSVVPLHGQARNDMSDTPEWKKVLQEPNAVGWIGFFILVIAIGFATLYFGDSYDPADAPAPATHAAR